MDRKHNLIQLDFWESFKFISGCYDVSVNEVTLLYLCLISAKHMFRVFKRFRILDALKLVQVYHRSSNIFKSLR